MKRQLLLQKLKTYKPYDAHEKEMLDRLRRFVVENEACFERSLRSGHLTGSAWVVDSTREYVLLTHHKKLDKWLQLGGHADGEPDIMRVALREAREESGVREIRPVSEDIFDVDIHAIPECGSDPEHFHYDVRFLFEADRRLSLRITPESKALVWIGIDDIPNLTKEESVMRMIAKTPFR